MGLAWSDGKLMRKIDYKWVMLALVSSAYFLAQGTRQIYNSVLPQIKSDFLAYGVTDTQLGIVGSAFTLAFGIAIPFAGLAADFFRRKWMIVAGMAIFSLGIFLSGFASGLGMLVFAYGILNAAGQSLMPPANSSLIGQFHVETRGTAFSIYQMCIYVGTVVCSCAAGWLASLGEGGWRKAFVLFGIIGFAWVLLLVWKLRDTPSVEVKSKSEKGTGAEEKSSVKEAVLAMVGKPTALLLMLGLGFYFYALYGFKTWLPMFLVKTYPGVTIQSAAFHGVFWFYLGAMAGVMFGGRFSDRIYPRRRAIRIDMNILGLVLAIPLLLGMAFAPTFIVCVAASGVFGFATGVYDSNLYASLLEVVKPRYRAAAVGLFGCGGCVLGALGPGMLGWMSANFSMRAGFASLAVSAAIGAVVILVARYVTFERDRV